MNRFTIIESVAAPLAETHVDTDVIFPARFLLLPDKKGLGEQLFNDRRANRIGDGERFVLDTPPWDKAEILVAGEAFGTGSSREQAVWALADFGVRCVIAPSFGEIFHSNCFKNGLLPIVLGPEPHALLMRAAKAAEVVTIDLEEQRIGLPGGVSTGFDIDPYRKRALLLGLDEIELVLQDDAADIAAFEVRQRQRSPWLFLTPGQLSCLDDAGAPSVET